MPITKEFKLNYVNIEIFSGSKYFLLTKCPFHNFVSFLQTPSRHYVVRDEPSRVAKSAEQVYSYSYNSSSDSSNPYSSPSSRSYTSSESVSRSTTGGPGGYSYSSERTSRTRGDGPGGYSSSYSSTTSGVLPGGTRYRHYSYRV